MRQAKTPESSVSGFTASRTQMSQDSSNSNLNRQAQQLKAQPVRTEKKIGRNELVTIRKGDAVKVLKFKKAQSLLTQGWEISG